MTTPKILTLLTSVFLTASGWSPHDRYTWWLEIAPILVGFPFAVYYHRKYKISNILLIFLFLHAVVLMIGGHYTYAEVPLFNWIRDIWGLQRNHYDRVGHFTQGFVPALIAYEVISRKGLQASHRFTCFLSIAIALAVSASYEIVEWWVSEITNYFTGEGATAFLGTQGDIWDTQWDMLMALIGAVCSMIVVSKRLKSSLLDSAVSPSLNTEKR